MTQTEETARLYRRFAEEEAAGSSPFYETVATTVAGSLEILEKLSTLPPLKRQPNLLFAATRHVAGDMTDAGAFVDVLLQRFEEIAEVMRARRTQTNEPARCATLMPLLAAIEGPLALIEVGASAGLCLFPDLYGYDWGRGALPPPSAVVSVAPTFECRASPNTPLPDRHPEIVWRKGLDLNPLNLKDPSDVAWLKTLVWPEHADRRHALDQAIHIARHNPPDIVTGDLMGDLDAVIDSAPKDASLVVFHSAVLAYVKDRSLRQAFAEKMCASELIWISNEGASVFPELLQSAGPRQSGQFLLSENGVPKAWTHPHGRSIDWIAA